jgi:hypothetical protein
VRCRHGHDFDPRSKASSAINGECPICQDEACTFDRANLAEILTLQVLDTNEIVTFRIPRQRRRRRGKLL